MSKTDCNQSLPWSQVVNLGPWNNNMRLHRYRLSWTPQAITWSIDGQVVHQLTDASLIPSAAMSLRVILRTAVGGKAAGPDSTVWLQNITYTSMGNVQG